MFNVFGYDNHRNRSPWDGAPHWAIELAYMLSAVIRKQETIMASFQDLVDKLNEVSNKVDTVKADVDGLEQKLQNIPTGGMTADQQAQLDQAVQMAGTISDKLTGIDTEVNPPAPPVSPPSGQ